MRKELTAGRFDYCSVETEVIEERLDHGDEVRDLRKERL
jgi:hypothetical protein